MERKVKIKCENGKTSIEIDGKEYNGLVSKFALTQSVDEIPKLLLIIPLVAADVEIDADVQALISNAQQKTSEE